jgi:TPR repeat protein
MAGFAIAQLAYGIVLHAAATGREEKAAAAQWIFTAAMNGLADAQYQLALMLHIGEGIESDLVLAAAWLELAVAQGHTQAKLRLGRLLESGADGGPVDPVRARALFREAAEAGQPEALESLEASGEN